ncbi:transglycosylase family protein [Streptomyces sp. NPDC002795]|uniref:transglycosylase family protein n=1 Tax=Streptomyces sp. NPDC002795 TaxID=3364665 RepID=UPI0036B28BA4
MLSGNGRHRRPRQAPALVVAAGVAGSAIAIPLFAASGASAATTQAWDKLAECESGGQWSLDAGNGYYGGLQFTQERWEQYGGLDYAPRADQASRSQQISVAEKVLDDKGVSAWPMCSLTSGLTNGDDSADVDPGVSASPQPSESAESSASSDTDTDNKSDEDADKAGSTDSADSTDPTDSGDKSHDDSESSDPSDAPSADSSGDTSGNKAEDSSTPSSDKSHAPSDDAAPETAPPSAPPSASPSDEASDDATSGRHRGDRAADDDDGSDSRTGDGRHASRDDKRAGDAYEVHAGDNLWDIAKAQDVHGGWGALYERNKETVGTDPDLILPGQSLDLGDGTDKR